MTNDGGSSTDASRPRPSRMQAHGTSRRDPYIDNAKIALIALVVVGHLLETIKSGLADGVYLWIYSFHMPAFILISGYLSRSFTGTVRQCKALVTVLIAPYVIFQVLLELEGWLWRGADFNLNLFTPTWTLWYIMALIVWRLITPLLRSIPNPFLISAAVSVASVLGGGVPDQTTARILSFLPFFTLGFIATPSNVERFKAATAPLWVRCCLAFYLLVALFAIHAMRESLSRQWLYMYGRYDARGLNDIQNVAIRALVLIVAISLVLSVLAIIPRSKRFFSALGERTLHVYLLHSLILYPMMPRIGAWPWWNIWLIVGLIVGGVLLSLLLGTRAIHNSTKWLVDPFSTFRARRRPVS
ncbi:MAG TPA: acyltransferase family protein [Microbacteriaceae bacterium]